ncbi:MAG: DEAD/DEAH box helicase [Chloroflexi bacterium]|nr:DEAD/DEAH box helicase [Chloroflexota bacterium]
MSEMQTQIERRQQRALEEIVRVTNRGRHPLFSPFDVVSISGRTYRVTIRSLDERRNTCTCPDYRTNLVGTCKHIEGVVAQLKQKYADRLDALAAQKPATAQIFLHYAEDISVRATLPLPRAPELRALFARNFDSDGILQGALTQALPALLAEINALPARLRTQIVVDDAVREHLELVQDRESVRKQKEWFLDQVAQGNRSLSLLNTRLYPYQEQGALHLAFGGRTLLADDMGLGKTIEAIPACSLLQQLRDIKKVLVITPASLKHQWAREIRRFTALSASVVQGGLKQRREIYAGDTFFTLVNYELVRRDLEELEHLRPDVIILDEAQRIKNWRTKTADAVKRLRSRYGFVLTGTPLENRLDELYSVFQFLDPRILGPLWHFNDRFYELETRDDGSYKVLGYKGLDELRHTIAPYVLRRTRDQVLRDLPPRVDNNFFVEMTPLQIRAYDEFKEIVARLLATSKRRPLTPKEHDLLLKALIKMRLICNALALHDKAILPADREKTAPKLRELHHILDEQIASNGHKAIVFSQWEAMLDFAKPILERLDLGHVKLAGSVPTAKRGEIVDRFLHDSDCRVFLSTDAGGVGLNLQAADLVINLDLPWNPAVLEQRIGRAHRHGQLNPVHVVNLIAQGTIEERMLDTLAAKRNVFGSVFGNEDSPTAISFRDSGQGLLRRLDAMLGAEIKPVVELEPVIEEAVAPKPTLRAFAELLVARFPGRILLVRKAAAAASGGYGAFVVVDREPGELRAKIESLASEYFVESAPTLHLMEQEGYRAFLALAGKIVERAAPEDEAYRAPALPAPADGRAELEKRLQKARTGFEFAAKRAQLADVVLRGGFPEETIRPLRDALGWALSSHLALAGDRDPNADLPSARVIQAELVEPGQLSAELAAQCAQARELTEPPADPSAPPLSPKSAEALLATVRAVIEAGQKRVAEKGL